MALLINIYNLFIYNLSTLKWFAEFKTAPFYIFIWLTGMHQQKNAIIVIILY